MKNIRLKYSSEVALIIESNDRFIFRASDIQNLETVDEEIKERFFACNIYFICKRPRISIIPDSISIKNDSIYVKLSYLTQTEKIITDVDLKFTPSKDVTLSISAYPHRNIIMSKIGSVEKKELYISNFVHEFEELPSTVKDLEVLYIGKGIKKSAKGRIESHSTLQKILAEVNSNEPESEIFILTYNFEKPKKTLLSMNKVTSNISIAGSKARERLEIIYNKSFNEEYLTSLTEAILISYFKTKIYNTHYLHFPKGNSTLMKKLSECDFSAVVVDIDNENIGCQKLFSNSIEPNFKHTVILDLRSAYGFYQMFKNESDA